MPVSKAQKKVILSDLGERFQKGKSLVFVKNLGVDVNSLTKLKREMKKNQVDFKVAKKTLIQKAFQELKFPEVSAEIFGGPIAIAISYEDELAGAKLLKSFMKDNQKLEFAGGLMDNKLYSKAEITTLASLPGKTELLGKVVGSLKSPLYGLHNALSYHLRGLVQVLAQVAKQKSAA